MRLLIKQRVFSWTDSYDVYDEEGKPKYFVKAEFLSLGHQLHVYDCNRQEIGVIHQKLLTFLPAFEIEVGGIVKGEIQKQFTLFCTKYEIDYNGWRVEGDFLGWIMMYTMAAVPSSTFPNSCYPGEIPTPSTSMIRPTNLTG